MNRNTPQQPEAPRSGEQQPMAGGSDRQRPGAGQQTGSQQQQGGKPQQMGEGSYEASRDYKERIEGYMDKADIERDAQAAKPRSEQEAREMQEAEREGRSHSRGER